MSKLISVPIPTGKDHRRSDASLWDHVLVVEPPYSRGPCRELHTEEVHLYSVPLVASAECIGNLEKYLAPDEWKRAGSFRTAALRDAFILGRGLLRTILGRYSRLSPSAVGLAYGARGKPHLLNNKRLRFNLSHSGGHALFALALDREIGVDIEHLRPMSNCEEIARRVFSVQEYRDLLSLARHQRGTAFFTCWTRKEAYIKAVGDGLSLPLDSFRVSLLPGETPALVAPKDPRVWSLHDVSPGPGFVAALAGEGTEMKVRRWTFATLEECARYFA